MYSDLLLFLIISTHTSLRGALLIYIFFFKRKLTQLMFNYNWRNPLTIPPLSRTYDDNIITILTRTYVTRRHSGSAVEHVIEILVARAPVVFASIETMVSGTIRIVGTQIRRWGRSCKSNGSDCILYKFVLHSRVSRNFSWNVEKSQSCWHDEF